MVGFSNIKRSGSRVLLGPRGCLRQPLTLMLILLEEPIEEIQMDKMTNPPRQPVGMAPNASAPVRGVWSAAPPTRGHIRHHPRRMIPVIKAGEPVLAEYVIDTGVARSAPLARYL